MFVHAPTNFEAEELILSMEFGFDEFDDDYSDDDLSDYNEYEY